MVRKQCIWSIQFFIKSDINQKLILLNKLSQYIPSHWTPFNNKFHKLCGYKNIHIVPYPLLIPQTSALDFFPSRTQNVAGKYQTHHTDPKLLLHTVGFPGLYCFTQNQPSHPIPDHERVYDHVTATITWLQNILNIVYETVNDITHTLFF
jgi:hypothetical protein